MTDPAGTPTGTVTCLFSDIEGSTRLELDIGTGPYRDVLETHRRLLRAAWAAHQGQWPGRVGEGSSRPRAGAGAAGGAAADAQRALAAATWPPGVAIRVRMGLNTGEIESTGRDVVGLAINRTARIAAAAHGGQVLLSDATRALVSDDLPDGVTLRDLGEHRLKDLRAPERLAQLVIDGLEADFPPPRTIGAHANNLPTQLTTFVGREREVLEAGALLERTRLLTLTGPGGTGKTRLSLQIAATLGERFPDGVWFVPLEPVRDVELVVPTVLRTMGVANATARPPIDVLADTIGDRRLLLVLDNFEQVVAAGPVIAEILRRCPQVTCLVTSRTALRVSGEQEFPIAGLPAPPDTSRLSETERLNLPRELREHDLRTLEAFEAVRLFIARAAAVRPGFAVTEANAPAVAAIAARLHGMPLALELAAARAKLLSPDQILTRLEHHLTLLTTGSQDLPERQRTLRGAIAWSYELLDEGARRLLDRLSVFRGGFDLGMAEAVCGPADEIGGEVVDRLGELLDQSLVRLDESGDAPRFSMLETIREYAAEMLAAREESDAIAMRHAAAVLAFVQDAAPRLTRAGQRTWLDRLELEHDNVRAAMDWATARPDPAIAARLAFAAWRFWQQRGYLNEARARFDAMAAKDWALEPVDRARFAEAFGGIAYWQSDTETARYWYDAALEEWRALGDRAEIANALYDRAYAEVIDVMAGRARPEAIAIVRPMMGEALAIYEELGDQGGVGNVVWGIGSIEYFLAEAAGAERWYRRSLDLHRAAGDRTMEAWSLHMLGLALAGQKRWDEARTTARHALQHFYEAGDISGVTLTLDDLAIVAEAQGEHERGGRLWGAARHLQDTTGVALADYVEQTKGLFGIETPRDALPADDLRRYAAQGAAMGLDEVVGYALGLPDGRLPTTHPEGSEDHRPNGSEGVR